MKRLLFLFVIGCFVCQLSCAKKVFVEMEFYNNSIVLDDGTDKKPQTIKNSDGKDLKFKTLMGALNYMSLQGWEFVEIKSITSGSGYVNVGGGSSRTTTNVTYIFSKDISDEELQEIVERSYK